MIANVKEEEEEQEYEEERGGGDGRGETLGHGEEYVGYHGETMGYSMPVGMGIGVPMERVPARGTRPLPIPGASQPLSGSSERRKRSFVGGFWVGLRRLPKRVLRYGSRKTKVVSPQIEQEQEHTEQEQQEEQERREWPEQEPAKEPSEYRGHSEPSEYRGQSEPSAQSKQEHSGQSAQSKQERSGQSDHEHSGHDHSPEIHHQSPEIAHSDHHSPETAHIPPATDYIKMTTSYTMPSSFTNDPSFTTELNPLSRCLHALYRLPWISNRSTVDYSPLAGFGAKSGGRGVLKKQGTGTSWYRRPGDDPNGGGITGHSLDLLAAEGDGASVSAWRRRVAKRRYHHHHHHHRRHRHEHRRHRHRSTSTITFEERRQPMPFPFPYFPAFSGPSDPTAEMPGEAGRPPGGRVVYMPMMPYI